MAKRSQVLTSVASLCQDLRVRLFPNLARDVAWLQTAAGYVGRSEYRLLNTQGQPVRGANITASNEATGLGGLPSGNYSIRVWKSGKLVRKLSLQVPR